MTKRIVFLTLLAIFALSCKQSNTYPTWSENFNGDSFDESVWSKIPRGQSQWDRNMSDCDELFEVKDGFLILRGTVNPDDTLSILTGGLTTRGKKSFGYGRLEVCAKLQGAGGAWPAIWMMPDEEGSADLNDPFWDDFGSWKNYGEIDICERLNFDDFAYQTIHSSFNLQGQDDPYQEKGSTGKINPNEFNVYAVEHYRDSIKLFINGINTLTYKKMPVAPDGTEIPLKAQWTFDRTFDLRIDMQVGGTWAGEPVLSDLPIEMKIDWIRFYEFE